MPGSSELSRRPTEAGTIADGPASDRQISEASRSIGVSPRVLRYWEQLGVVRPTRGPHGRRHFTRHDLLLMALVRGFIEEEGRSIGELRLLRDAAERSVSAAIADPLLRLQLLLLRQASEPYFHQLMEGRVPPPPDPADRHPRPQPPGGPGPGTKRVRP